VASEIRSWQIMDGKLTPVQSTLQGSGRRERDDLEAWIRSDPTILSDDVLIIGEQVQTASGPLDFLGVDSRGNTVVIELKRDKLAREALVQAIDYASDLSQWDIERFGEICLRYTNQTFEDVFQQRFEDSLLEDLTINQTQRILLVGFSLDDSLSRMIEWLSDKYSVGINAVLLSYVKTAKGEEVLSRTAVISGEEEKQNVNRHKYIIEMSDSPGKYEIADLEIKLTEYLSNGLYSSQRLKDYFLPLLLEKGKVTREELRKEFVKRGAAPDESQAGYFLSLISGQLGHKWKDYLRQVVTYEYPNHSWEKDNFSINKEYVEMVKKVLEKLRKTT
jgi:hypothetical protein